MPSRLAAPRLEKGAEHFATLLRQYPALNQHPVIEEVLTEELPAADRHPGLGLGSAVDHPSDARMHDQPGSTLYVTLEPCAMCAMAMVHARVARVVYGATDPKTGAAGSVFDLLVDPRHNHRIEVTGGVLGELAGPMLTDYFRAKRRKD